MAPKNVYLPILVLVLVVLASSHTTDARVRGREALQKYCKYVGGCSTQAQCSSMCNGAGMSPYSVYCDAHREGGPQCCCVQN